MSGDIQGVYCDTHGWNRCRCCDMTTTPGNIAMNGPPPMTYNQYNALIARLRELRDAPLPSKHDEKYEDVGGLEQWLAEFNEAAGKRDLAIELLAMLGEE